MVLTFPFDNQEKKRQKTFVFLYLFELNQSIFFFAYSWHKKHSLFNKFRCKLNKKLVSGSERLLKPD